MIVVHTNYDSAIRFTFNYVSDKIKVSLNLTYKSKRIVQIVNFMINLSYWWGL